jgi:hypothetical protein
MSVADMKHTLLSLHAVKEAFSKRKRALTLRENLGILDAVIREKVRRKVVCEITVCLLIVIRRYEAQGAIQDPCVIIPFGMKQLKERGMRCC